MDLVTKHQVNKIQKKKKNQAVYEGETSDNNKTKRGSTKKSYPLVTIVEEKVVHHSSA